MGTSAIKSCRLPASGLVILDMCYDASIMPIAVTQDHGPIAGEEEDLDLGKMVREGEVAWLYKRDMPGTGHAEHAEAANPQPWQGHKQSPPSPQQGGSKKRKEPPSGRHSQPTSRPSSAQTAALKQGQHGFQLQSII